ncbi:transcription factor TGA2.1-like [Typha angustifolia]|uniref:transcription factor TGA2.1-like n=1 Tax=Typha angustifolia TaxID=59011 RepID=UPI003C2E18DC
MFTMMQGEDVESWMANHRVGVTGFPDSAPLNQLLVYGIQDSNPSATDIFDQQEVACFDELEESLLQEVSGLRSDGDRQSFFSSKPSRLDILPSPWPMRFEKIQRGNSQSAGSTDSCLAKTIGPKLESEPLVSRYTSSEQSTDQQQHKVMANNASMAGEATNHQPRHQSKRSIADSDTRKDGKLLDAKTFRRLAQNREAAKKSRLRKKAYVQQLESSRVRLQQLELDLQRARSQGISFGGCDAVKGISSGASTFDMEHARWLDENNKHLSDLRAGLQAHLLERNLGLIVDRCILHYDKLFGLKAVAAKADVFHLLTGMWSSPVERRFMWIGGFRPSELLQIIMPHMDPLREHQLMAICNLQQSSQQAEEALSQGLEQLHQSLAEMVATGFIGEGSNVGNYMGNMAMALDKLENVESFVLQADRMRQETLHQMRRILTIRQAARFFLTIGEYYSCLRALSSLWASRPQESFINNTVSELQDIHQLQQHQLSSF